MNYWTKKFNTLNKKYWGGKLSSIKVNVRDLIESEGAEGLYHFPEEDEEARIEIERTRPLPHKINILLHEMCLHAVEELYEKRPYHFHGTLWKEQMRKVGFKGKINSMRGRYKTRLG